MQYRAEIDGLRAVAVIPVVFYHFGVAGFPGGFVGVDIFFAISGFLITSIILAQHRGGGFSYLEFYSRRIRRIIPALYFTIILCIPFAWAWMTPNDLKDFSQSICATVLFSSNFLFLHEGGSYFAGDPSLKPLLHTWTLAIEEQFYILFPFLLVLLDRFRNWCLPVISAVLLLSLGAALYEVRQNEMTSFYLLPTRAWELMAGGFCAIVGLQEFRLRHSFWPNLGLVLILGSIAFYNDKMLWPSVYTVVPVLGAALIVLADAPASVAFKSLRLRPLVLVGLMSYSLYLIHHPLIAFYKIRMLDTSEVPVRTTLLLVSFAAAYLSWRYVETPFRRGSLREKVS